MGMESIYKMSVLVNMIDSFTGPSAHVQKSLNKTTQGFQSYTNQLGEIARNGTALIAVGEATTKATMAPIKAIFGTQNALGELSSLAIEELGIMEQAAKDFSQTWAGTTKPEFLTAAYDIKSGIASLADEGVADMTRIAGVTAKATKSTITEMTSLFATGYGIYKGYYDSLSDEAFGEMFSAGIAKSVQQFKTTGSGMAQAISALGGSATAAGAPLEEQLAILGMLQATMGGSEAGTKYTAFLQSAAKAGQELGLNFTDANGQLRSMPEILGAIRGKFGDVMTAADKLELQKAFGTIEAVKLIDLLYNQTDDLQGNIVALYDTMGQGMKITEEMANKINAPPGQSWMLLQQKIQSTLETVGNAMLPTFTKMQEHASALADGIGKLADEHPTLISNIMFAVMAMGSMYTVIGILKLAFGGLGTAAVSAYKVLTGIPKILTFIKDAAFYAKYGLFILNGAMASLKSGFLAMASNVKTATLGMFTWVKQGILAAWKALPGLIGTVWKFTAALLSSPITWVVGGIIVLIGVLVALWQNWDAVVTWFVNGFNTIKSWFGSMPGWIQAVIAFFMPLVGIPMLIVTYWEQIKAFFIGMIEWFRNIGAAIWNGFTNGIMSVINAPFEVVKSALAKVRQLLPFSDAKEGPLSDLTLSGSRVFTTFNDGMAQTADLPANTVEGAFEKLPLEPDAAARRGEKTTIIEKVILYIKPDDIADLQNLKKLLDELEGMNNANIGFAPVPEV